MRIIVAAFLDGSWEPTAMAARAHHDLGLLTVRREIDFGGTEPYVWLHRAADLVADTFVAPPRSELRAMRVLVAEHAAPAILPLLDHPIAGPHTGTALVSSAMSEPRWPVVHLDTVGDVAAALGLLPTQLSWFADVASLEQSVTDERLRHYRYRWVAKSGSGQRLVEAPKQTLRRVQRWVLRRVLHNIPVHPATHGFVPGRSVHTYVGPHVGRRVVVSLDLRNFFTSVAAGRVFGIFRVAGYADSVAHTLTGLMTNAVPADILRGHPDAPRALRFPHLPQGAPTSPALANLAAFSLDRRLSGLATAMDLRYTRYADDLAFSSAGGLSRRARRRLVVTVEEIARAEGFDVNRAKTRAATAGRQQRLAGRVVNAVDNAPRRDYDRLRAVLHDASINGPVAANREGHPAFEAHLRGRIHWVASDSPARQRRLWQLFDQIDWSEG
ncbi:reverse transcriptase family protein [Euzebya tangerina]|uniref:reverse transcriptase family protein n=1 Tax=Euzebya tangerina TaxID=591198 RepID=UPI000E31905E|nr:reverse transcriptase family protein [Euzebya tangerina]